MKTLSNSLLCKLTAAAVLASGVFVGRPVQAGNPPIPHVMSTSDYLEGFDDIANWTANFAAGIGAEPWGSVAVNATGAIPDGQKTTVSTATFSTGTSGGVQKGTGNIILLATGSTDNTAACAIDLYLDFTGRSAGTLSFDWTAVANSTGNRASSLRVYTSTDGTTWAEVAAAAVLNVANNVTASGSITAVSLPTTLNGSATARIRFYECNGTGGSTGSRAKIAIDNVAVTSGGGDLPPVITHDPTGGNFWTGSTVVLTATASGSSLHYQWQKDNADLANGGQYSGVNTATLNIANVGAGNAGAYRLVVTNSAGTDTSEAASVTSSAPLPQIDGQPQGGTYLMGINLQLSVSASVAALNAPALTYVWKRNGTALTEGAHFIGVNTATLTINGLASGDAGDYSVDVTNPSGTTPSSSATVAVVTSGTLAQWNFNGATNVFGPAPSSGVGVASLVGTTNGFIPPLPANPGTPYDFGDPNNYWGTSTYPATGVSNKTTGVQFTASTVGLKNIGVSLYTRLTAGSSKYSRLQYTTNGTTYLDFPSSSTATAAANQWDAPPRAWSLNGFPGVRNNPSFGIRVVTELESTATYGMTPNTNYVGLTSTYSTSATVSYDLVTLTAEAITSANVPPTISPIADQSTTENVPLTVNFTVSGNAPFTFAASSSNQTVIADWQLDTSGSSGTAGKLQINPVPGLSGVAPILVFVTDAAGDVTTTWFYLTIAAANATPTITQVPHTNTLVNTPLSVALTVGDDAPVGNLQIAYSSSNPTLLPNANISITGTGTNRTLTLTPASGKTGVAPVEITVTDAGFKTASTKFTLMVRPNTTTVFNDSFAYPDGPIVTSSYGLWNTHSGTAQQMDVTGGWLNITEGESEDINAKLIGQPYATTNSTRLYSSFILNYTTIPSTNGYFAHFKDDGTSNFRARVWGMTNGAAPSMYRLSIANSSGNGTSAIFPLDLETGKDYVVVTRIVVSNGVSTLWINPVSEASASVTDNIAVSAVGLTSYAFRQAVGEGTLKLDELKIGQRFADVVDVPADILITGISVTGSAVTVNFDAGTADTPASFDLLGAGLVDGAYTATGATITSPTPGKFQAVTTTSGATHFYRVKRK